MFVKLNWSEDGGEMSGYQFHFAVEETGGG